MKFLPFSLLAFILIPLGLVVPCKDAKAVPVVYSATAALNDSYGQFGSGHAIIIAGLANLIFEPGAASLTVDNNQWNLKGVASRDNVKFNVNLIYSDIMNYTTASLLDPMVPKKELKDSAYIENGGPINPNSWIFAGSVSGTLTGISGSDYAGLILDIAKAGPAAQFGVGANGKNIQLGLSNWLTATVRPGSPSYGFHGAYNGDVNINAVPEPASILLLGLGSLASAFRKRRIAD